jgi:hypothetical protein
VSLSLPVYLAETIHPEVRGTLGMMPATLGNTGVMLSYILGIDSTKLLIGRNVFGQQFYL